MVRGYIKYSAIAIASNAFAEFFKLVPVNARERMIIAAGSIVVNAVYCMTASKRY